ncbi:hypothetical protein INT45_004438 [Circinella minor]|uniref:Uncharacterized protein n=1 Tax=Circinella minor TaxID=1195481 RepID=A0A8H7S062_9FUNG|nr:hypothetical protein INT45_004438 [Circinella minor]
MEKYAKHLLKATPNLKKLAKKEKKKIRLHKRVDRNGKKIVVKILKLFVKSTNNGERLDWLKEETTEAEFVARFITPFIDLTLKSYDTDMIFKPGEQKLLLMKDYENSALTEDDTRLPGSNIDDIIKNTTADVPIGLVEVSGSPNNHTDNFNHYNQISQKFKKLVQGYHIRSWT